MAIMTADRRANKRGIIPIEREKSRMPAEPAATQASGTDEGVHEDHKPAEFRNTIFADKLRAIAPQFRVR